MNIEAVPTHMNELEYGFPRDQSRFDSCESPFHTRDAMITFTPLCKRIPISHGKDRVTRQWRF